MPAEILTVLVILVAVAILLVADFLRIDIVALLTMLALGWSGILTPSQALSGFSSNAVAAMMGVMIMGAGIARTGLMDTLSRLVIEKAGARRSGMIALMSLVAGSLSGFVQNIGAAVLFLPGIMSLSRKSRIPASALVMPVGFATILGGTLTMVGSGPLIIVNDLLQNAGLKTFGLFAVTPVGLTLLTAGILLFLVFGQRLLPIRRDFSDPASSQEELIASLHIPHNIWHYEIPENSSLVGQTAEESGAWEKYQVNFLGVSRRRGIRYAPCRNTRFKARQELAILGDRDKIQHFARDFNLLFIDRPGRFARLNEPEISGFAEVIIPHQSEIVELSLRQYGLRKRFNVEPIMLFSKGREIRGDFSDHVIGFGDTLIVFGTWKKIQHLKNSSDFVVATPFSPDSRNRKKTIPALVSFFAAIGLALSGFSISLSFFSGAMAMLLLGVLKIDEAYRAIEWKVVFLLAGLIPLGLAMQKTGAAAFLAEHIMSLVAGSPPVVLLLAIALLASLFSVFMSNVGAIVILAPLVIHLAHLSGLDPRPLVLLAAVCAANSFVLPTHQVNALLMSAGGYRNADYIRAGGGMSVVFVLVAVTMFYLFYI